MSTISVQLGPRSYVITIGPRARESLPAVLKQCGEPQQVVIIADQRVADLHLDALRAALPVQPIVLMVPPGEATKSLEHLSGLYDALAEAHVERGDVILAFGGGVVGDLAGFAAATWLRGIPVVQVPTTLLAAVDASVGGKTGINHPTGKNLIGAFHQPAAVVIDTEFLSTLPARDFAAGLAESVKHSLIRDSQSFLWHEEHVDAIVARDDAMVTDLIARNCTVKSGVVAEDEREHGLRAILNFGHTIGHALEHLLDYELRHGECVGLGMIAANEVAWARGLLDGATAERCVALLGRLGLPVRLPRPLAAGDVVRVCRHDKKVRGGAIHFILLTGLGQTVRVGDVTDAEIAGAVEVLQP
ncbi:MAG: 3-dehydroquinate synthase [Phycisphaerae bacterium]|jgi:3-dehydroquinate synthase